MVKADGTTINTYTVVPQITTAASGGTLSVDIVNSGGTPVGSPSVPMGNVVVTIGHQTATGTFGTSSERIRVDNGTGNPQWTLTVAAQGGSTSFWDATAADYDFNDPTSNAGDGGDADSLGGQLTLNASV